jgi:hypothetical protein
MKRPPQHRGDRVSDRCPCYASARTSSSLVVSIFDSAIARRAMTSASAASRAFSRSLTRACRSATCLRSIEARGSPRNPYNALAIYTSPLRVGGQDMRDRDRLSRIHERTITDGLFGVKGLSRFFSGMFCLFRTFEGPIYLVLYTKSDAGPKVAGLPNIEAWKVFGRVLPRHRHLADASRRRARATPGNQAIDVGLRALEDGLDAPIRQVPHEASQT